MGRTIVTEQDVHERTRIRRDSEIGGLTSTRQNIPAHVESAVAVDVERDVPAGAGIRAAIGKIGTEVALGKAALESGLLKYMSESEPKADRERTEQLLQAFLDTYEETLKSAYRQYHEALKDESNRQKAQYLTALRELEEKHKLEKQTDNLSPRVDDYMDRLMKYIPAESVALYLTLQGIILSGADASRSTAWLWAVFGIGVIGTPLYLWRITKVSKAGQIAVSTAAFIVWVFALGGAFSSLSWYEPFIGALALVAFTFFAPLINPDLLNSEQA